MVTSLKSYPTVNLSVDTLVVITIGNQDQAWRLDPGVVNPSDPKQLSPADYNVVNNDKHWQLVSEEGAGGGGGATSETGGNTPLINGQDYVDVTFPGPQPDTNWDPDCTVENTVDPSPSNIWTGIVNIKTLTGFRVQLNAAPDSSNYLLRWRIIGTAVVSGDTAPPTAPGTISATATSPTQVHLSWGASTDDVGVTGYLIERQLAAGGWFQVASTVGLTYDDTGLAPATNYGYRVRARDAALNLGAYSTIVTVTTPAVVDTSPPTTPSGLTATTIGANQIHLSWTGSTDDTGVTGYLIERQDPGAAFVQIATTTGVTFDDSGLTAGTIYVYRVRATDAALNLSSYSTTATATTSSLAPPPQPPSLLVDDNFNRADGILGANWTTPLVGDAAAGGTFRIVSNQAAATLDNQHTYAVYSAATFSTAHSSQITVNTIGAWTGVCLRAEPSVSRFYLVFVFGANDYRIYVYWDGSYASLAFGTAVTWSPGDIMRAEVSGGDIVGLRAPPVMIRMYRNGVMVLAWVSTGSPYIKTTGNPGIGIYNPGGSSLRDDDWEGANLDATYFSVVDDFNRADGALGANWTTPLFSESTLAVASNHCGVTLEGKFCNAFWSADSFSDNQYAQFVWSDAAAGNVSFTGVILRADAVLDKFYMCLVTDRNVFAIYARWTGATNLLTTIVLPSNMNATDVVRAEITGTTHPFTIHMYRNGIFMGMWQSTDNTYSRSGGSPGIAIFSVSGNHLVVDDWQGGDLP